MTRRVSTDTMRIGKQNAGTRYKINRSTKSMKESMKEGETMGTLCLRGTPAGPIQLEDNGRALVRATFRVREGSCVSDCTPLLLEARQQLLDYFSGNRTVFTIPLEPAGTAFQKLVYQALCEIPFGQVRSYKEIAQQTGHPKAYRAVGMANHCNPIAIFIPCHRVIGHDGRLTGYAGGLDVKRRLLALEGCRLRDEIPSFHQT